MATETPNRVRRRLIAGSASLAVYAGFVNGRSADGGAQGDLRRNGEQLAFISQRWEALPRLANRTSGCVLGLIDTASELTSYAHVALIGATQPLSFGGGRVLMLAQGPQIVAYNVAEQVIARVDAPAGYEFSGGGALLPSGKVAVGLSTTGGGAAVGIFHSLDQPVSSVLDLERGAVREMSWSDAGSELLVMQEVRVGTEGWADLVISGCDVSSMGVSWSRTVRYQAERLSLAMAAHPRGGAILGVGRVGRVPTFGNESIAPDLTAPLDLASFMNGWVEHEADLLAVGPDFEGRPLATPEAVKKRGLGTITTAKLGGLVAATFWDSDVVLLFAEGRYDRHFDAHDLGLTRVAGAAFLDEGRVLAVAGMDRYVALIDPGTGQLHGRFRAENLQSRRLISIGAYGRSAV